MKNILKKSLGILLAAAVIISAAVNVYAADTAKNRTGATNSYAQASQEIDDEYGYDGTDLGATYSKSATTFKVWAPTATSVSVNLYKTGTNGETGAGKIGTYSMTMGDSGVWSKTVTGDHKNQYYTYSVTAENVTGSKTTTKETQDIYSVAAGANGARSQIVDLDSTDPTGWEKDSHVLLDNNTDSYVWEVHVKDFSYDEKSGVSSANRGKYLAFTETGTTLNNEGKTPTLIDHLKKLGVTTVQILPFFDFARGSVDETGSDSQFSWGYEPANFNVPEGSYSSNPYDGNVRIKECKQMIQALHNAGISVVMDVVYNHTTSSSPSFEACVPNYYYRMTSSGGFSNGTGCGNETASERKMFRNFMIQSCMYWINEYHIDGFRFDLMGVHDVETMNLLRAEMDKVDPRLTIWGEGWTGGTCTFPDTTCTGEQCVSADRFSSHEMNERIAFFNESMRDSLKGSVFELANKGWVQGNTSYSYELNEGIMGNVEGAHNASNYQWTSRQPTQTVSYTSCHDNQTLWDRLAYSQGATDFRERNETYVKQNKLTGGLLNMALGITFTQAGEEMARSKDNNENSYNASATLNMIDWENAETYSDIVDYYKGMREIRAAYSPLRSADKSVTNNYTCYSGTSASSTYAAVWHNGKSGEWNKLAVLANDSSSQKSYTINSTEGKEWVVIANGTSAGTERLAAVTNGTFTIPAYSMVVAVDKSSFDSAAITPSTSAGNVYTTSGGTEINLKDTFKRGSDDTADFGLSGNTFKNLELLGVQKKSDGERSIRFVAVLNNSIIKDADDYGFIAAGYSTVKDARDIVSCLNIENAHLYSCKGSSNTVSGDYGKFSAGKDYKYVTFAVNNIGNNAVAAKFYIKKGSKVFYADYTNDNAVTYNNCSVNWALLS